jgi:hypothetical protein
LGERRVRIAEVGGSIPLCSTNFSLREKFEKSRSRKSRIAKSTFGRFSIFDSHPLSALRKALIFNPNYQPAPTERWPSLV